MKKHGQILLISISIGFTLYQNLVHQHPFFTVDFFIFTIIAWIVGRQYDKAKYFEKKARASEDSYKQLLDSLPEMICIHRDHTIIYANKAACHMFCEANKESLIGNSYLELVDHEYRNRYYERIKQAYKEKQPLSNIEYKLLRPDGSAIFVEASSLYITFGEKEAVLSIVRDITERKGETERLLQKSEKLALLGQMAAGLAHEIRNPLTSIKGFIQLFKASHMQEEYYDIVLSELDRINSIVSEFLVLAKPSAAVFVKQDIKEIIHDVVTFVNSQLILSNVQISVELDNNLPMISCEVNQMKQVFLNLIKNAIEAMPDGGFIHIYGKEKGEGEISIQIIDQGIGIPKERISTLGEPFYTTKEKGTGLGLMTCFKIIESHHGKINIESKVNEGTMIQVILPTITQSLLKKEYSYS